MKMQIYLLALLVFAGCDSQPSTMRQRQDDAMRDPMNYSPHVSDQTDISGGGTTEFKKDAFKRDVNSVINP